MLGAPYGTRRHRAADASTLYLSPLANSLHKSRNVRPTTLNSVHSPKLKLMYCRTYLDLDYEQVCTLVERQSMNRCRRNLDVLISLNKDDMLSKRTD